MNKFRIIFLVMALLMAIPSLKAEERGIELEPRMGYSLSRESGAHAAMFVGIPFTSYFSLRPGLFYSKTLDGDLMVPINASFKIPLMNNFGMRVEGGGVVGTRMGVTGTVGFDISKVFVGTSIFADLRDKNMDTKCQLSVSIGYRFSL